LLIKIGFSQPLTPQVGQIKSEAIDPQALGLQSASLSELKGGEIEENAQILRNVLQGTGIQPNKML